MTINIVKGNIFTTNCQTIVNAINCVGVMGAGIALEFKLRYPEMFQRYVALCESKQIDIGKLWIYKSTDKWILNFPTKKHWKTPSEPEFIEAGLIKFIDTYRMKGITSIAFPLLGTARGGIDVSISKELMIKYLDKLDIYIEIYDYDPSAPDELYNSFVTFISTQSINEVVGKTNLRKDYVLKLIEATKRDDIHQINQLARVKGIGLKTIEKIFSHAFFDDEKPLHNLNQEHQINLDV